MANGPIVTENVVQLYYTGITTTHGGYMPKKQITVARAAWRLDGWVSLDAAQAPGMVETAPMLTNGQRLMVNVDATGGELRAEILDASGTSLPGYRLADCRPVVGDGVRQPVEWETRSELPSAGPVSIRFELSNANFYSFSIG